MTLPLNRRLMRAWAALVVGMVALPGSQVITAAQQHAAPFQISILTAAWGEPATLKGLIDGLMELGHQDGVDFIVGVRFTRGDSSGLVAAAREVIDAGADVVVAIGPAAAEAAAQATQERPIIFVNVGDPIGQGLIESFGHPGGNITGVASLTYSTSRRRLQLFKELVPGLQRVVAPYNQQNPYHAAEVEQYSAVASDLGIELVERPVGTMEDAATVIAGFVQQGFDGILAPRDVDLNIPGLIIQATLTQGIPSMFDLAVYVEAGGLASFGGSAEYTGRQTARMIDQLMRGVAPADIPAETSSQIEFVLNLNTASQIGLTISPVVMFQADRFVR